MIIGIDPDLEKSGVAILGKTLELKNLNFAETVELFRTQQDLIRKVVIEAGWLNRKSNFHGYSKQSKSAGERIAKNVGENHATGKLLAEMAQSLGLAVVLVKPVRSKLNAEDFNRITGWRGRSNQEQRDAGMLIHGMK
ncbi:hypothetical protein CDG60_08575 [Acinetobacter chinensis]|uniref:Holliday junction resolvase RuvC n=1 Tax=Acinetobacter chinensis TaxID=2004650 RepID=A0A3B7LYB0_9GAMM|nr:hypothetical protein [Acinetobacter chinensis]AXY56617.1 hypothetical protein CDG60_08575 [Acinetobacter chinensis]